MHVVGQVADKWRAWDWMKSAMQLTSPKQVTCSSSLKLPWSFFFFPIKYHHEKVLLTLVILLRNEHQKLGLGDKEKRTSFLCIEKYSESFFPPLLWLHNDDLKHVFCTCRTIWSSANYFFLQIHWFTDLKERFPPLKSQVPVRYAVKLTLLMWTSVHVSRSIHLIYAWTLPLIDVLCMLCNVSPNTSMYSEPLKFKMFKVLLL